MDPKLNVELKKEVDSATNSETIYVIPTLNKKNQLPSFPMFGVKLPDLINMQGMSQPALTSFPNQLNPSMAPHVPMRSYPTTTVPPATTPEPSVPTTLSANDLDLLRGVHNNTQTLMEAQDLLRQILDILSQRLISEPFKAYDEQYNETAPDVFEATKPKNTTLEILSQIEVNSSNETKGSNDTDQIVALHSLPTVLQSNGIDDLEDASDSEEDEYTEAPTTSSEEASAGRLSGVNMYIVIVLYLIKGAINLIV
ncbi:unnamed protein product [Bursaphelenchus okinawaensis]|uniref:Uncharacterized protein n=1 Tax=Bursaphelenchus okinawaensis TaxID=465554 RepID=A0A811KIV0_9BILA|nr:unnamed protein product [Bursaphelenchus okinawaensis]CAG9103735.1 unnamed protein product [Bursaphelenchus okinawaensis]